MISIVVPVYNVKKYVLKCLTMLSRQNFDDYEVIVVDDGSTDGSGEIVDSFCNHKQKFKVIHKSNGGLMSAWMEGLNYVSGDYVGFVDSDDYPAENMFNTMYSAAKKYDVDIVYCDYYAISDTGITVTTTEDSVILPKLYRDDEMEQIYKKTFPSLIGTCISNARWNKIFRTDILLANIQYCSCMSRTFEDRYIVPACMFSAKSFLYIKEPLYYYLHREGSNCGKPSKNLLSEIKRMNDCQKQALLDKGFFNEYMEYWNHSRIDSIKQFVKRNILGYGNLKLARQSAKELIGDDDYRKLIVEHKKELIMNGKTGRCLFVAARLKFPFALWSTRIIQKRKYIS